MATPFCGELRLMSFDYPPRGWAECNGQILQVNQYQQLFSLLGTQYGGDGKTTFGLPELRGRVPIHLGPVFKKQGERVGEEFHKLTEAELPAHTHEIMASSRPGSQAMPAMLASSPNAYRDRVVDQVTSIHPETLAPAGGGQGHENRHPLLVTNWCIALSGIHPSPS
jgi:microcystin-dependent protein